MGTGRKYILKVDQSYSSGLTYVSNSVYYNLLNPFSGTTDNGDEYNFSYTGITTTQLSQMSSIEYNKRVFDFMCYINVDTMTRRNELINSAEYDEISCDT